METNIVTDLEKQFFSTFGIEPHEVYPPQDELFGTREEMIEFFEEDYPQISDRILLELICIINQSDAYLHGEEYYFEAVNYKDLKEEVLSKCKRLADKNAFSEVTGEHIKHQVQALFKEG